MCSMARAWIDDGFVLWALRLGPQVDAGPIYALQQIETEGRQRPVGTQQETGRLKDEILLEQ